MEWTLDLERIFENPLMTPTGRTEIRALARNHAIRIPSLTADCCMQAPFWKAAGQEQEERVAVFEKLLLACGAMGIGKIILPLVDGGTLSTPWEEATLKKIMLQFQPLLQRQHVTVAFESDYAPPRLAAFMQDLPAPMFGINYDMGNSASLGWEPEEELPLLAHRIVNVHVKDRPRGGTTVPLGQGAADFTLIFSLLKSAGYAGNYILQTARAADGRHVETLCRYADLVARHIGGAHAA